MKTKAQQMVSSIRNYFTKPFLRRKRVIVLVSLLSASIDPTCNTHKIRTLGATEITQALNVYFNISLAW